MTDTQSLSARILVADDEMSIRTVLSAILRREGYRVSSVKDGQEAIDVLRNSFCHDEDDFFDLLIADISMPKMDGMQLLEEVAKEFPNLPVVMLTAHGTVDYAVSALKKGALDFLTKPYEREDIVAIVRQAIAQKGTGLRRKSDVLCCLNSILVGTSQALNEIKQKLATVANTPSTVLITGENGTGKELVAHALHEQSSRAEGPFVHVDCSTFSERKIQAEFFGYEKGSSQDAKASKPGRLELAHEGTLFLDGIEALSIEMQAKLLRVLKEGVYERVGGVQTLAIDVRLIAASHTDLEQAIKDGTFSEDLFYKINVVPIRLPALRERLEDIEPLVKSFIEKFNHKLRRNVVEFTSDAIALLKSYSWPGNLPELESLIERILLFSNTTHVTSNELPPEIVTRLKEDEEQKGSSCQEEDFSMKDIVKRATSNIERDLIIKALNETRGNVTQAALLLKISRKGLQIKMKDHALRDDDESFA